MLRLASRRKTVEVFGLLASGIVLIAVSCRGGDETNGGATAVATPSAVIEEGTPSVEIDPCTLLTLEEAQDAAGSGLEVKKGVVFPDSPARDLAICNFVSSDKAKGVSIGVKTFASEEEAASHISSRVGNLKRLPDTRVEEVAGVGDDAFWLSSVNTVLLREGPVYVEVAASLGLSGGDANREAIKALAEKVLARVP